MNQDPIGHNPTTSESDNTLVKSTAKPTVRARAVDKIRSELNIEKWPAIWQPAKSKNKPALRVMEREVPAADGSRVVSRVEVGYTQLGTLSTEEQKLLYVLIKFWEETGKPGTQVFFSTRELARMLKKKGWGTNVIQAITKSLRKLRTIPIEWINSYYDQTKLGAVVVDRRPFTLLNELRVIERRQDGAVNSAQGYFKFDDHILTNLQLNYTKPVCIDEFFKLKSEIAQLIYTHIDLMLCDKTKYERRTRELFDDLGLRNAEYGHMYERKRAIERGASGTPRNSVEQRRPAEPAWRRRQMEKITKFPSSRAPPLSWKPRRLRSWANPHQASSSTIIQSVKEPAHRRGGRTGSGTSIASSMASIHTHRNRRRLPRPSVLSPSTAQKSRARPWTSPMKKPLRPVTQFSTSERCSRIHRERLPQ